MKTCIIIPNYNHGSTIDVLLSQLISYQLPAIVVDDGSDALTKAQLTAACAKFDNVHLLTLPANVGKGGAVLAGIKHMQQQGFTHALQIDADGQHKVGDIPKFLQASQSNSEALIAGLPVYDHTVPKSRLYGRRITNFWVGVETLSWQVKDAMCGFRIYPIEQVLELSQRTMLAKGMSFDIEIMVRLIWQGAPVLSIPTPVIYPEKGISHFNLYKDNVRISWVHTKLFFGMLKRLPFLVKQMITQKHDDKKNEPHWASMKEVGVLSGLKVALWCYRVFGKRGMASLTYLLTVYFYITNRRARQASQHYLTTLQQHARIEKHSSFNHFLTFSQAIVDKLAAWNGDIGLADLDIENPALLTIPAANKEGGIILTAHLGNIEIARALSQLDTNITINVLVFHQNSVKINQVLKKLNSQYSINLIEVQQLNIQLAIALKERVDAGEFIVIVADRTSTTHSARSIKANFLGHAAYFPQGPFILAGVLACPVYFMLCLKKNRSRYQLIIKRFAQQLDIKRSSRHMKLSAYAQQYADLLENYCQQYPLQWFNFFDFWQDTQPTDSKAEKDDE